MSGNGSCTFTRHHIVILNSTITSLSFVSLIVALVALVLNRYHHFRCKDESQADPIKRIFLLALINCVIFELSESFQWFVFFKDFIGCAILGAIREYLIICSLIIITCKNIHLLLLMTSPKCLRVIKEEKQKRYGILVKSYFIAAFFVPLAFLPWPLIKTQYGDSQFLCWLRHDNNCDTSSAAQFVIIHNLAWQICAAFSWLFSVAVTALAFYKYCKHQLKPDRDILTLLALLCVYVIKSAINFVPLIWITIRRELSFPTAVLVAVITPLSIAIYSSILIVRQVGIMRESSPEIAKNLLSVVSLGKGYKTTSVCPSETVFKPADDDEWYSEDKS